MKKYLLILLSVLFLCTTSRAEEKKEVIIFSQPSCYFCEQMNKDLENGITAANPDIKFIVLNVHDEKNRKMLHSLTQKHSLHGSIGTPLLFIGKNYMMGWGEGAGKQLQSYINELKAEKLNRSPAQSLK